MAIDQLQKDRAELARVLRGLVGAVHGAHPGELRHDLGHADQCGVCAALKAAETTLRTVPDA